jgi:ATP-dependent Clp protease adaptor protein ClpS
MPSLTVDKSPELVKKTYPKYKVILHNDDHNSFDHVISSLMQVLPGMSVERATNLALEAHESGSCVVITCDLEPAEFYCESLRSKGLTSTIEPE